MPFQSIERNLASELVGKTRFPDVLGELLTVSGVIGPL